MPCQKLVKLSYLVKSQSVVFVSIILVGGVWTGIAYSQDGRFRKFSCQKRHGSHVIAADSPNYHRHRRRRWLAWNNIHHTKTSVRFP
ncbi:hypothetical protein L2E82_40026 [Cichorium intybus]|uniref:Uncharacterized protein n=1 Tax=Cichorium intybus TaxID=13427 RepID=A0ACB9AJ54_CICIN|nr:hypothetical protein L2E82_40026 [Cichorium intybus]